MERETEREQRQHRERRADCGRELRPSAAAPLGEGLDRIHAEVAVRAPELRIDVVGVQVVDDREVADREEEDEHRPGEHAGENQREHDTPESPAPADGDQTRLLE